MGKGKKPKQPKALICGKCGAECWNVKLKDRMSGKVYCSWTCKKEGEEDARQEENN